MAKRNSKLGASASARKGERKVTRAGAAVRAKRKVPLLLSAYEDEVRRLLGTTSSTASVPKRPVKAARPDRRTRKPAEQRHLVEDDIIRILHTERFLWCLARPCTELPRGFVFSYS
jgi:hypothetical protein